MTPVLSKTSVAVRFVFNCQSCFRGNQAQNSKIFRFKGQSIIIFVIFDEIDQYLSPIIVFFRH